MSVEITKNWIRERLPGVSIPEAASLIIVGRENLMPVRTESCPVNLARLLGWLNQYLPGTHIQHARREESAAGEYPLSVRTELRGPDSAGMTERLAHGLPAVSIPNLCGLIPGRSDNLFPI